MNLARVLRPLKILAALYAVYLALVVLIATPLLNNFAPKIYREQTGHELQLGKIVWLNPFTLELTAHNIRSDPSKPTDAVQNNAKIQNPSISQSKEDDPLWSIDTIRANVALASLWRGHLVLDTLELRGLDVQIDQTAPNRFNFSDILDYRAKHFPTASETMSGEPATIKASQNKPFSIEINKLALSAKHIGYRAPHATEPVDATFTDVDFSLLNFSTLIEKGSASQATAILPVQGAHIEFTIKTFGVKFLREQSPFTTTFRDLKIASPTLSTTSPSPQDYVLSVLDGNGGSVQINGQAALAQHNATGVAQVRALNLIPAWQYLANKLAFTALHAQLDGDINYHINWNEKFTYKIKDSQLALRDVQLQSRADSDTNAAFSVLSVQGITVDSSASQVHIARAALEHSVLRGWNRDTKVSLLDMIAFPASDEPSAPSPWHVLIDAIDATDGSVHWRANQLDNRQLTIAPLAIHMANLHWPDAAPLQFNATTIINGDTDIPNVKSAVKVALDGELVPGDITGRINGAVTDLPLTWGNSFLQQQMRATIMDGLLSAKFAVKIDKAQPTLIQSDGTIDRFELQTQTPTQQTVAGSKLVAWKKLEWRQLELRPAEQHATLKQIITTQPWLQFRINTDGTNNFQQLMVQSSDSVAKKPALTPDPSLKNDRGEGKLSRDSSLTTVSRGESALNKPWQFALDNFHIDNATIDFRDASLTSAFRTNITALTGDIDGLNSNGKRAAKVGLKGTVDGYAPVALTGSVNPFTLKPTLNIALDITNLDLATLTPYAGTYAGYQIDGGRLSVQLNYKLENNRIKGTNHIIINEMQLGKQVTGPKVMDLPLRFAIYLLTDANGVMDLGVDVAGDVDDPDFSVGSIIWKAFRNLIVKTVSSPFRALANIAGAGGRDDLDRIEFQSGSDRIAASETEKLQSVNTALQKKSALTLSITGHVSPSHDLEALRDNTLSQQLVEQSGISETDIRQQSKNWQRAVTVLFKKRFPGQDIAHWEVMQMNDAMRDNIELESSALQNLAAQRALAVKQLLVADMGLATDRAFVKPVDLGADKNPGLQATLEVE
jgi:hypothetical protein